MQTNSVLLALLPLAVIVAARRGSPINASALRSAVRLLPRPMPVAE